MVLARQIFGDLNAQTVVLVGAGEMVQLCGRYLRDHDIANLLILNRSLAKAEELASELNATAMTLDRLDEALPRADILISSTASPDPVIRKSDIKKALKQRRLSPEGGSVEFEFDGLRRDGTTVRVHRLVRALSRP